MQCPPPPVSHCVIMSLKPTLQLTQQCDYCIQFTSLSRISRPSCSRGATTVLTCTPVLPKEWMQKDMKLSMILYDIIQIGTRQITPSEICIILYIIWMLSPIIVLLLIQKKSNVSIDVLSSRLHNLANSNAKWIKGFMSPCPLVFYTLMIKRTFG